MREISVNRDFVRNIFDFSPNKSLSVRVAPQSVILGAIMIVRRTVLLGLAVSTLAFCVQAYASEPTPFTAEGFAAAQKAGKSILVHITAPWCPTCKAQRPILGELTATPAFKDLTVFDVDFDAQKDVVNAFGARMQSTLIVFKAGVEVGRSVGDTNAASIKALLDKAV